MKRAKQPLLDAYARARAFVLKHDFEDEIQWQRGMAIGDFSESDLLRETAWVILCSGFRESAVRRIFGYISLCFCDWDSARCIVEHAPTCRSTALAGFNHPQKIDAIIEAARDVCFEGFTQLRERIILDPLNTLQTFHFIGPITSIHLAKNLGWQFAKPDRHLIRLARRLGVDNPQVLCEYLAKVTGDPVNVIDIILWRYAAEAQRANRFPGSSRGRLRTFYKSASINRNNSGARAGAGQV